MNDDHLHLRLYVAGATVRSQRAVSNLTQLLASMGRGADYDLELVDVLERPDLAEADQIMVTPTLVRRHPLPVRRLLGDLSDWQAVGLGLELEEHQEQ